MDIKVIPVADCCVCQLSEIAQKGTEQMVLSAVLGRVFITGENDYYLGVFSVDSCDTFNRIDCLRQIPVITSETDLTDNAIEEQAKRIFGEKDNRKYGILPIVNNRNRLIGGVSCPENWGTAEKIACLARLEYYKEKHISLEDLFASGAYKRIAFWGLDELSLAFANETRHFKSIELLGIYENKKRQKYIDVDFLNYEIEVNFVDAVSDVVDVGVDLIIVTDWTMRNIIKHPILKEQTDIIYLVDIIANFFASKVVSSSRINDIIKYDYRKQMFSRGGTEVLMVRVPTESDMGLPKKALKFKLDERFNWLEQQGGWKHGSPELKEFNQARRDVLKNIKKDDGLVYYADFRSKNLNLINKQRVVLNAPKKYDNTLYLIGPCIVLSQMNSDENSLGYFVQEKINERNMKYRVVAFGMPNDADRYYWIKLLKRQDIKSGDRILIFDQTFRQCEWDIDLLDLFNALYTKYGNAFYYDIPIHCGKEANSAVADYLCDYLEQHPLCESDGTVETSVSSDIRKDGFSGNPKLKKYQEFLQNNAIHKMPKIGSIVMNCNPFTLGHQYLVEYAAARVDYLYIFIVEEDKSYFKFEDRIKLAKTGTSHLKNVKVLPSGQFIISSMTFSEYFDKANLNGMAIDTSLDVETFGGQIAPCLNISVRFVGEEPLDPITAQYNQSMKEILPRYGIELQEIPRKELDDGVISASRVRKSIEDKQWDEIRKLVPNTTFSFLYEKFK